MEKRLRDRLEWNRRTLEGEYGKVGEKDPRWDQARTRGAGPGRAICSASRSIPRSCPRPSPRRPGPPSTPARSAGGLSLSSDRGRVGNRSGGGRGEPPDEGRGHGARGQPLSGLPGEVPMILAGTSALAVKEPGEAVKKRPSASSTSRWRCCRRVSTPTSTTSSGRSDGSWTSSTSSVVIASWDWTGRLLTSASMPSWPRSPR